MAAKPLVKPPYGVALCLLSTCVLVSDNSKAQVLTAANKARPLDTPGYALFTLDWGQQEHLPHRFV